MYTLVIKNATVIDGRGNTCFVSDIGIEDGKIKSIENGLADGEQTIDAFGLIVTPGFIDSHSHSDKNVITFPDMKEKIEQGITFSITGQCGTSETPKVLMPHGTVETPCEYFSKVKEIPQGAYSAMLIGHNSLRIAVMGKENRDPFPEELNKMKDLLREGLKSGAIGMSLGLFYVPGAYAKLDEVIELAKVVAEQGGIIAAHLRNEGDELIEATEEFLTVIKESGCRAVFSHHKAMWHKNHGKVFQTIEMINKANREGADIYLDVYPYCASSTSLLARFVPGFLHPENTANILHLLYDATFCDKVKKWGRETWGDDLSFALVTDYPPNREYEGMTVSEIARMVGETDQYETVLSLLRESKGAGKGCYFCVNEEDLCHVIKHPKTMICTDSEIKGTSQKHHPRLVGSFPRAIAKYVREKSIVSLSEMIRKMTFLPASVYGLKGKGSIEVGMDADLCIFDAERITDRADYVNCSLTNEGLHYVIVNGKIVLSNGQYNGARAASVYTKV